jgi:uncharacterized protein
MRPNTASIAEMVSAAVLPVSRAASVTRDFRSCKTSTGRPDPKPGVEAFPLNTTAGTVGGEIERVCSDNELVIATWSPIHLRTKLKELYWKGDRTTANAAGFFEDTLRYLYLPRLKTREVLAQAIRAGTASKDFLARPMARPMAGSRAFPLEAATPFSTTLLLIEPQAAQAYEDANRPKVASAPAVPIANGLAEASTTFATADTSVAPESGPLAAALAPAAAKPKTFYGTADVPVATAKMRLVQIADEIVSVLTSDPNATVRLVVEISAEFPDGAGDAVRRAISENARSLGLKSADWE